MNTNRQTTVIKGNNKESNMKITTPNLIRWAGLSAGTLSRARTLGLVANLAICALIIAVAFV